MAKNYKMYQTITCISKYYATKEEENKYIHTITNQEEYDNYKIQCLQNNYNQTVYMEYYTNQTPIKPFFDIDAEIDVKMKKKETQDMDDLIRARCLLIIQQKYPNNDIIVQHRPIRKLPAPIRFGGIQKKNPAGVPGLRNIKMRSQHKI